MGNHHSTPVCPTVDKSGPTIVAVAGNLTFHSLSTIISGAAGLLASLIALFLIIHHATHFSNPAEQKQIIRILCIIPMFALISFLSVWLPTTAEYLKPGLTVAESFPLAAFFLLMSTYCIPDEDLSSREAYFSQLQLQDKKGNPQPGGSLAWYRNRSFSVLQLIPVSIILWVVTVITLATGSYCATSNSPHFAHIWVTVLNVITTAMAITSILYFYKRMRPILRPHKTLAKLAAFKLIVFLNFLQTTIFSILNSSHDLKPTSHLSYNDLNSGIPNLLLSLEILLISPLFIFAYSSKPYMLPRHVVSSGHSALYYQGGVGGLSAIFDAINIVDIVMTLSQGIKAKVNGRARRQELGRRARRHELGRVREDQRIHGNGNEYTTLV